MTVFEAIQHRRSIRKYKPDPIAAESWRRITEAGRLAPSASNRQPCRFLTVRDPEKRRQLAEAARGQSFIAEAPIVVVACASEKRTMSNGQYEAWVVDLTIALDHMTLTAAEEGVGTCWIGAFEPAAVRKVLNLDKDAPILALMPFGYPAESPAARPRKSREEVFAEA